MKRLYHFGTLVFLLLAGSNVAAQDFSNKGKDFWVAYGYHEVMVDGGNVQQMVLYFATEAVTTVKVSIPGIGYTQTYANIPANTVFTSAPIPKAGAQDARLTAESVSPDNKGIHIEADHPIVAYAHIYNASVSGATILFPTNTLGREYFSVNYKNISNTTNANCWFYVVACDTGTTTVEINPSAPTQYHPAGTPFTVNLTQGQVYNLMGQYTNNATPANGVDLTGSTIKSISTGTGGCKKIAVFSGSGRISITCDGSASSSDNYMVQAFPQNAWGKNYLTSPTGGNMRNNFFRICVSDPTAIVRVNNAPIGVPLQNNFYYDLPLTSTPQLIQSDKPILVAQYITSQAACGNGSPGDPEVIYLSPIEQNINKVLWNATPNFAILEHHINVIIPNTGTAISSFTLDGASVPSSSFTVHPQNPAYSYLTLQVAAGQHTVVSDSGFNAIAYGFGSTESYGYNAGTNVKDLYQFVSIKNQYATVNIPAACKNAPFNVAMTFPYQPTQIIWDFGGLFPNDTIFSPAYDSTWIGNGRQLYQYRLPTPFTITASGTYPIKVFAQNPTTDGCSGEQEIDYDLQVFDPPTADFTFTNNGCLSDTVFFFDNSNLAGRTATRWYWNFGDAGIDSIKNSKHKYLTAGTYNVKYSVITDVGCISDTAAKTVTLTDPPVAKFNVSNPICAGKTISFSDQSTVTGLATLVKWYWNFGDGSPQVTTTTNATQTHSYSTSGTYTVTLKVETTTGCQSTLYSFPVTVNPVPVSSFNFSNACLPSGLVQFTDQSTISDGTQGAFIYSWNFGDGSPTSTGQNPSHNYATTGPFNVTLTVTSNNGCMDDSVRIMNTVYAQPQAAFNSPAEVCLGTVINFSDQSTVAGGTITQWSWNFGDGNTSASQNPTHNYAAPGTYTITLSVGSSSGCQSITTIATKTIIIDALPTVNFNVSSPDCELSAVTFTDASVANSGNVTKWSWDFGDGTNSVLSSSAPFSHTYSTANTYNVTLQVQTDKGCSSTVLTKPVVINTKPKADFVSPKVCAADVATFTDASTVSPGNIVSWQWYFGDGGTSTAQNPGHSFSTPGNYITSLVVTTNNGCKDSIAQPFVVNGIAPVANFNVQNVSTLCSNKAINLVDASTVDFGTIVKVEIYWDYANDPTNKTTDANPSSGKIYPHSYPSFGSPASVTYTIRYVAYSGDICVNSITKVITLLASPILQFSPLNEVCSNDPSFQINQAQILNALPGTGVYSGSAGISPTGLFTPSASVTGLQTIRYTYNATNGCSDFIEQTIQVNPTPIANAGPDRVILEGGTITLMPVPVNGIPVTYSWVPTTGLDNPSALNPVVSSPADDITYTLTVTSDKGCKTSDDVFIKLLRKPVIPNIFSPNGDGIHDKWEIAALDSYPGCTVDIFNRYGQKIYHSVGYSNPWDGTVNGKPVPVGTYYYIVDPKNGRQKMAGYVDVIR